MEVKEILDVLDPKMKEYKDGLAQEVKAATDAAKGVADEVKGQISVLKDEAEKLQEEVKSLKAAKGRNFTPASEKKAFGDILREAIEEKTDEFAKMSAGEKSVKNVSIELKAVGDILTTNVTGGTVWGANYRPGIIEDPKRKVHMRQVVMGGNVGAGTDYYFMKQNGNGEGAISFTAEGATKPQTDEDLIESSVKIETLAGWARVSRKAMANIPGFVSFLQSRMVEKLLKAEDAAILYGTGTSPEIKGILTAGNFTASTSASTILSEKIIDDIAKLEDTYERDANLVLMRPQHYYGFFKNKAAGSGEYDLPQNVVISNGSLYISGILCVASTALAINTAPTPDTCDYVVGDFKNGAEFLTQESMRLEFFYEDGTNVRENKVTVRLEETVALPVFGSTYFIKGSQDIVI